jgi:hypothetical protein
MASRFLRPSARSEARTTLTSAKQKNSTWSLVKKVVFPFRHGEQGNAVSEIWLFSRFRWTRLFERKAWSVERMIPMQLFCTGYELFGTALSIQQRSRMSRYLGSSSMAYVVRPVHQRTEAAADEGPMP